jgi:16S rRNA (cytidine1402-2'-O)-methyltransferase
VVATPIGNLRDITLRALDILAGVNKVYAEDTRVARKLLDAYGLKPWLAAYHEHNAEAAREEILAALGRKESVALISDAGTPLVSGDRGGLSRVSDPWRIGAVGGARRLGLAERPVLVRGLLAQQAQCKARNAGRIGRDRRDLDPLRNRAALGGVIGGYA